MSVSKQNTKGKKDQQQRSRTILIWCREIFSGAMAAVGTPTKTQSLCNSRVLCVVNMSSASKGVCALVVLVLTLTPLHGGITKTTLPQFPHQ